MIQLHVASTIYFWCRENAEGLGNARYRKELEDLVFIHVRNSSLLLSFIPVLPPRSIVHVEAA